MRPIKEDQVVLISEEIEAMIQLVQKYWSPIEEFTLRGIITQSVTKGLIDAQHWVSSYPAQDVLYGCSEERISVLNWVPRENLKEYLSAMNRKDGLTHKKYWSVYPFMLNKVKE